MQKSGKLTQFVTVVVIIGVTYLIMLPLLQRIPTHRSDSRRFLTKINAGLTAYCRDHSGCTPKSLRELYPRYVRDMRLIEESFQFCDRPTKIIYNDPGRLGDPKTPVVILHRKGYTVNWALFADSRIHLFSEKRK